MTIFKLTYYHFKIIVSAALLLCFGFNKIMAQCIPTGMRSFNSFAMENVTIAGDNSSTEINYNDPGDNTSNAEMYTDNKALIVEMTAGNTYNFSITHLKETFGDLRVRMWIDFGGGIFTQVYDDPAYSNNNTTSQISTGSISIPTGVSGKLTLRIATGYCSTCGSGSSLPADGCTFIDRAEVHDYTIDFGDPINPVANNDTLTVIRNSTAGAPNQIDVSANDNIGSSHGSDGDDYSITSPPTNGSVLEISDGVFEYIPNIDHLGSDSFTYQLCDLNNDCATATVNITVNFGACVPTSNSFGTHYITNVSSPGESSTAINNTSGDNGGYGDFLGSVPEILYYKGDTYPITISVNNASGQTMGWSIYIDLNGDADFEDFGETLYDTDGTEAIPFATQNITIPTSSITGNTTLRIGTRRFFSSNIPCGNAGGQPEEFEDYLINLQINPDSGAEIDVTGNANVIDNGAVTTNINNSTDFGVFDIFSAIPSTRTFVITNNGGGDLNLIGAPVTITGSTDFSVQTQPSSNNIPSGNSVTFTIAFSPSPPIIGARTATVVIANNDADENPFTFAIEGFGEQTFPDTDNDGVPDNVDLDDDNDGLLDITEQVSCVGNSAATTTDVVFLNENFQSGTSRGAINGASYCFENGLGIGSCNGSIDLEDGEYVVYYRAANGDGVNDTPNGEVAFFADEFWYPGLDHTPNDVNGRMALFNADFNPGIFYETTITGVSAGVDITYGFSAINLDRADAPGIASRERPSVLIEILDPTGAVIASASSGFIQPTTNFVTGDWINVSATFNTTFTQFTVRLTNENLGGLGNDLAIDDIFVLQTLCDLDGDGVEDSIDLDNDNDGVPNVVELQLIDNDRDATVNNDSGAFVWVDINSNGVHDLYDPQDASGRSPGDTGFTNSLGTPIDLLNPIYDTDGDGVLDYLDLDSDNDGVFDSIEYDNRGDVDIDGDGSGDGSDRNMLDASGNLILNDEFDGDGILGPGDSNDLDADGLDHGTGNTYPTPIDDDGDGIPNFRDVDSDDNPNDFSNGSDIDKTEIYAHLDADNDGVLDDTVDTDGDGILDIFDTDNTVFGSPRDLYGAFTLFFDGRNDYVEEASVIDGLTDVTVMSWVKLDLESTGKRVILGQDEIQIFITNTGNVSAFANGNTVTSTAAIAEGIWVHVAAIYDGTNGVFSLYINGELEATTAVSGALPTDSSSFTLGRTPNVDSNYFKGQMDEVRVFTKALTETELQRMVYQELVSAEQGAVIPIKISTSLAGTLARYYKMDIFTNDITNNGATGARLFNIKDIFFQTAPLPYVTRAAGKWADNETWLHGNIWDIGSNASNKDWSIVRIQHNVNAVTSHGTFGLFVDSGVELVVEGNSELQNSWYLNLDGDIDLQGESQLVQTQTSTIVGSGILERDQQGTTDVFNYNYWSSPVHSTNPNGIIDGDESYTVASVKQDAKDPDNLKPINFVGGRILNGDSNAIPIKISDYWIWKFNNRESENYSQWQQVRSNGNLLVGEGYTMKGAGSGPAGIGNYAFSGAPNNGEINLFTNGGNDYLVGNPYPSSIDGVEFLSDNPHLNGTLYFWEHFGGGSHILREYQGGYGLYNFSGGTPALIGTAATPDPDVDQTGTSSITPRRYIPVGQGFFVTATSDGNTKFENDQRIFITQSSGENSVFVKTSETKKNESKAEEDNRPKIRIGYKSPKGYRRQLLVTVDEKATLDFDWGYEGRLVEDNVEDMYWKIEDKNYIIQGIGEIDPAATILPLGIKTQEEGIIEILIDNLENVDDTTEIYLKDNDDNTSYNLRASKFFTTVKQGVNDNRFEIVFASQNQLSTSEFQLDKQIAFFYNNSNSTLVIQNQKNYALNSLQLYNTLGQVIFDDKIDSSKKRIEVKVNMSTGVYVSKLGVNNVTISKKLKVK